MATTASTRQLARDLYDAYVHKANPSSRHITVAWYVLPLPERDAWEAVAEYVASRYAST